MVLTFESEDETSIKQKAPVVSLVFQYSANHKEIICILLLLLLLLSLSFLSSFKPRCFEESS